jgi:hypothetical protein
VPGVDVAINTVFLLHEVRHYMSVFGIDRERVNSLKDFDHSLLKCRSLLEPNFNMILFLSTKLGTTQLNLANKPYDGTLFRVQFI